MNEEKMANTRVVLTGTIPGGAGGPSQNGGSIPIATTATPRSHCRRIGGARIPGANDFNGGSYYPDERTTRGSGFGEFYRERRY